MRSKEFCLRAYTNHAKNKNANVNPMKEIFTDFLLVF